MAPESVTHISNGNLKFANKLYEILYKKNREVFYSPFSAHAILSLTYQGGDGSTAKAFENALEISDKRKAADGYRNVMEKLNSLRNVTLHVANKIFVQKAFSLKSDFHNTAKTHFSSEVESVNFAERDNAANIINNWVENKTNSKIKNLISPDDLDNLTRMVLVNALYFKGEWLHKFKPSSTEVEKFYISDSETVDCHMMHISKSFKYGDDNDLNAQILALPYKNDDLSLIIILPKSRSGLADLEKKILTKNLSDIYQSLTEANIALSLPRFKIETTMDLTEPLREMGLGVIFSNEASFPHMLDSSEAIKVSKVIQKAFIEVNEEGAEAAAATGLITVTLSKEVPISPTFKFCCDHPFIFALVYRGQDVVPLFMGKCANSRNLS